MSTFERTEKIADGIELCRQGSEAEPQFKIKVFANEQENPLFDLNAGLAHDTFRALKNAVDDMATDLPELSRVEEIKSTISDAADERCKIGDRRDAFKDLVTESVEDLQSYLNKNSDAVPPPPKLATLKRRVDEFLEWRNLFPANDVVNEVEIATTIGSGPTATVEFRRSTPSNLFSDESGPFPVSARIQDTLQIRLTVAGEWMLKNAPLLYSEVGILEDHTRKTASFLEGFNHELQETIKLWDRQSTPPPSTDQVMGGMEYQKNQLSSFGHRPSSQIREEDKSNGRGDVAMYRAMS
ncbi:hypothetical protein QFC20_004683 [Naganishia adeliensis]|uniref:Uncharacterized protein n=1 Tax=Naganishia adeliensis TaxID=92952 RepID=A0ACC2VXT0_9TREE|nr:hypothetical protein QFC20_004683 [Naganishia adeliensis]